MKKEKQKNHSLEMFLQSDSGMWFFPNGKFDDYGEMLYKNRALWLFKFPSLLNALDKVVDKLQIEKFNSLSYGL